MDLNTYIKNKKRIEFAARVGCSPAMLTQIIKKQRRPSPELAMAISMESGGAVTLVELLFPHGVRQSLGSGSLSANKGKTQ